MTRHIIIAIVLSAIATLAIFGGGLYLGWTAHKSTSEVTITNDPQNFISSEEVFRPEEHKGVGK